MTFKYFHLHPLRDFVDMRVCLLLVTAGNPLIMLLQALLLAVADKQQTNCTDGSSNSNMTSLQPE